MEGRTQHCWFCFHPEVLSCLVPPFGYCLFWSFTYMYICMYTHTHICMYISFTLGLRGWRPACWKGRSEWLTLLLQCPGQIQGRRAWHVHSISSSYDYLSFSAQCCLLSWASFQFRERVDFLFVEVFFFFFFLSPLVPLSSIEVHPPQKKRCRYLKSWTHLAPESRPFSTWALAGIARGQ